MISKFAKKVYSIDVSTKYQKELAGNFDNVEFRYGDSKKLVPELLDQINNSDRRIEFVLIDGDHSAKGVKADIDAILEYKPSSPLYIVFHDSFHPPSRQGILNADWHKSKYVHYVEVDFIPGVFHFEAFDTAKPKSMYGGLCVALLKPEERKEELVIHQSQKGLFETILKHSRHKKGWLKSLAGLFEK